MNAKAILSTKLTSESPINATHAGFLDKLEFNLRPLDLNRDHVASEFDMNDIEYEDGCFKNRQCYLKAKTESSEFYFVYSFNSRSIFKAIAKPSDFSCYHDFIKEFSDTLGSQKTIEELPITRVDKTIDIALSLEEVERGITVKFKRAISLFSYESGGSTGFQVGKNDEVIKLYSRTKKANLNYPCSRIEILNKGSKIQFKTLRELKRFWVEDNGLLDHSFKNIKLNNVIFKKIEVDREKQLYWLVSAIPYMLARARLNNNGNFIRDFKKVHYLEAWGLQPTEIFNTGMRNFFKNTEL